MAYKVQQSTDMQSTRNHPIMAYKGQSTRNHPVTAYKGQSTINCTVIAYKFHKMTTHPITL